MKLVCLNLQGGFEHEALISFIQKEGCTTDVFCFQEMFTSQEAARVSRRTRLHLLEEIQEVLPDFEYVFESTQDGFDVEGRMPLDCSTGQAIFVRNTIPILSSGSIFTFLERNKAIGDKHVTFPTNFAYVRVPHKDRILTVVDVHGISQPGDKMDTPERVEQSKRIAAFIHEEKKQNEVIVCGDFNLYPETESIKMIDAELTNLIKTFAIQTTRSKLSPWYGKPDMQTFADYTFCSSEIEILAFSVPEDITVSDHLPMILEFT